MNNPSRGPWALLGEFHLINLSHISVSLSLHALHLVGNQQLPTFKVFCFDSVQVKRLMGFESGTSEYKADALTTESSTGFLVRLANHFVAKDDPFAMRYLKCNCIAEM